MYLATPNWAVLQTGRCQFGFKPSGTWFPQNPFLQTLCGFRTKIIKMILFFPQRRNYI